MSAAVAAPPRHRAWTRRQWQDRCAYLKGTVDRLRAQAAERQAVARREVEAAHAEADRLRARLKAADALIADREQRLRAARVDLGVLQKELDAALAVNARLSRDLTATKAALQNATRVTVPSWVRDTTDGLDQPAQPIDVMPLQQALGGAR